MSEIKTKNQLWPVRSKNDVIDLYKGTASNPNLDSTEPKIGMEIEQNFYDLETLAPLNEQQSQRFICDGKQQGFGINKEPSAATLEIISDPFAKDDFHLLIEQINRRYANMWDVSIENKAFPSPFAYFPHIKAEDHYLTTNERYTAFWNPPRPDVIEAAHSFLDPSIQISVSYKDLDHLLRIVRMSVVLEPFFILTTEADGGFYEGGLVDGSPRTRILKRRGRNGGVPDFYLKAQSGEELIDMHIDHSMHNKHMFVAFDEAGTLNKIPDLYWASFSELEAQGIGPQNLLNYRQAQSMSWRRAVNIAEIRDDEGSLFGHRAEVASLFCTGLQHQRASAAVISYLLAYCPTFYGNIRQAVKEFGMDMDDLYSCKSLLEDNFEHVHHHKGRYFDLPFGNKTIGEFAREFSKIIQDCLRGSVLNKYSAPLLYILEEGRPDWLVRRESFKTLDQQKAFMRALPALAQEHPQLIAANECADFSKHVIRDFLGK